MGQSKKLSYMTQLHLVVNTYTKYEKDPLSEVKSIEETRFCLQTDRRTDKQTDRQSETSIPHSNKQVWV